MLLSVRIYNYSSWNTISKNNYKTLIFLLIVLKKNEGNLGNHLSIRGLLSNKYINIQNS
jgi:hypothetical protein